MLTPGPREKQLKSRLTQWGFDIKNLKSETVIELARTKDKRALENKKSAFRVNKKPVDDRKIDRCLQRNDVSEEQLLSMASLINAPSLGFSVYTPASVRTPTLDQKASTRSSRSPTPDLNLQRLSLRDYEPPAETTKLLTIPEENSGTTNKAAQSPTPLYIQPGAENSQPTTTVTLPDGVILIILGESSLHHLNSEGVDLVVAHNAKNVSVRSEDIHKPSPYCGWSIFEEEEAERIRDFNSWLEWRSWLEMRKKINEKKGQLDTQPKFRWLRPFVLSQGPGVL